MELGGDMGGGKGRLFCVRKHGFQASWQIFEERCPQHPRAKGQGDHREGGGFHDVRSR